MQCIFISSSDTEFISLHNFYAKTLWSIKSILGSDMKINFQKCAPFTSEYLYPAEPQKTELGPIELLIPVIKPRTI